LGVLLYFYSAIYAVRGWFENTGERGTEMTNEEMLKLAHVYTTPGQARVIYERNMHLIDMLNVGMHRISEGRMPFSGEKLTAMYGNPRKLYKFATHSIYTFHGCPHCSGDCGSGCAWEAYICGDALVNSDIRELAKCYAASFNGVTMREVRKITATNSIAIVYYADFEYLDIGMLSDMSRSSFNKLMAQSYIRAMKFLTGHIEWAVAVMTGKTIVQQEPSNV
jgi:hypothetical protein